MKAEDREDFFSPRLLSDDVASVFLFYRDVGLDKRTCVQQVSWDSWLDMAQKDFALAWESAQTMWDLRGKK